MQRKKKKGKFILRALHNRVCILFIFCITTTFIQFYIPNIIKRHISGGTSLVVKIFEANFT